MVALSCPRPVELRQPFHCRPDRHVAPRGLRLRVAPHLFSHLQSSGRSLCHSSALPRRGSLSYHTLARSANTRCPNGSERCQGDERGASMGLLPALRHYRATSHHSPDRALLRPIAYNLGYGLASAAAFSVVEE